MLPLEPSETIQRTVHRSIFGLVPGILLSLALLLGGGLAFFLSAAIASYSLIAATVMAWGGFFLIVLTGLFFAVSYFLWRTNRLILTNLSLISVTRNSLFRPSIDRLSLARDFSTKTEKPGLLGFFSWFFHYGTLIVQTGDGETTLTFYYMPNVQQLEADIKYAQQPMTVHNT